MSVRQKTKTIPSDFIYIYTLGDFRVYRGEKLISLTPRSSHRLWSLFTYLVVNRSRSVPLDELLNNIWAEDSGELKNPEQALRTSIYRLRQMFDSQSEDKKMISSPQGRYQWNSRQCWLDIEEFERKCRHGAQLAEENPERARVYLKEALELYKGSFLSGFPDIPWMEPHRNYYRRLYVESVSRLNRLLKADRLFKNVIRVSERAALLEPFEEGLHISLMEALLEEGKNGQALAHYEYATSLCYREMGVKPSPAMRDIYRRLSLDHEAVERDLNLISGQLRERDPAGGVFQCDTDIFRYLYKLEERKMSRDGRPAFLVLFTLSHPKHDLSGQGDISVSMQYLNAALTSGLRQGDVICRWNEAQFLVLLRELNQIQAEGVINRIDGKYHEQDEAGFPGKAILHASLLPLTPVSSSPTAAPEAAEYTAALMGEELFEYV